MFDENNKSIKQTSKKDDCECNSTQGFFMPSSQASMVVASLMLLSFVLFVGGFFWGQKNAIASFTNKIEQESFGDQIYSSLCSLCDSQGDTEEGVGENDIESTPDENDKEIVAEPAVDQKNDAAASIIDSQNVALENSADNSSEQEVEETSSGIPEYYAQLAGFGTMRAAQHFANRLHKKEISVIVKKRQSRSMRGKFVSWYQVVTEKFNDKGDLEALIKRLEYEEKLNDVRLITC